MKAGVIGYGYWGRNIARVVQASSFFELETIFDLDKKQILAAKKLYHFVEYENFEAILKNEAIGVLFIITPPQTHFTLTRLALQANKHVFVEKPLCMQSVQAEELYAIAKEKKCVLHCDHIFLYAPPVQWMKKNLKQLGKIVYINARRINLGLFQNSVDVIWDLAIHDLSIIDYLIGLDVENIEVFARKFQNYQHDAFANINLELKNGVMITINVSWLSPIKVREMMIGGENKSIIYDETKSNKIALFDSGVIIKDKFENHKLYQKMVEYKIGETSYPTMQGKMALDTSLDCFVYKIQKFKYYQHQIDEKHVLRILRILEKISSLKI